MYENHIFSSAGFCVCDAASYPRWPPGTLIGWDIFYFFSRNIAWTVTKLAIRVPLMVLQKCCYILLWSKTKMAAMDSDWLRHFWLLLKNHCMYWHQTCHKCSSNGPALVLLLFGVIENPRWPPWTLIGWDIFDFFSRTTACTGTKIATNVLLLVPKKWSDFLLLLEIQDGHYGLWLAETFSTSSQEPLHVLATNLPQMFFYCSQRVAQKGWNSTVIVTS